MKRLVFCFDGTWNRLAADYPSNVVLVAESIKPTAKDGSPQIVFYDEGVGTANDSRWSGGAFGAGLIWHIREAFRFLIFNYEPGDEIFAFGFSRGGFSARSFVGFIRCAGIPAIHQAGRIDDAIALYQKSKVDSDEAREFRMKYSSDLLVEPDEEDWRCSKVANYVRGKAKQLVIRYVGVWDTVGALGLPAFVPGARWLNKRFVFHSCDLTDGVEYARHAVAIDERRKTFPDLVWNNIDALNQGRGARSDDIAAPYQQKWFPGDHGSVGGTGPLRKLSDDPLGWVLAGAKQAGLELNTGPDSRIFDIRPDYHAALTNDPDNMPWHDKGWVRRVKDAMLSADRSGPDSIWQVSAAARRRWSAPPDTLWEKKPYRPKTLAKVAAALDAPPETQTRFPVDGLIGEHEIARGDTLGKLALLYYSDAKLAAAIAEANRDVIDDPNEIYVGWKLRIPRLRLPAAIDTPPATSPPPPPVANPAPGG
jgi:uncharacterized protein (DUF2235 family)